MIGYRNMLCGMHVHVEVPDVDARINLIMRLTPYLPLLLAFSTSSPFWQGHLTGLVGYRLAAYDELPRTGLPELFRTNGGLQRIRRRAGRRQDHSGRQLYLVGAAPVEENPTIELRVADSCTRLDDAVAIAALFRCLVRALDRERDAMPASTASAAPSPRKTSGTPSAMASPRPSSIRSRIAAHAGHGSTGARADRRGRRGLRLPSRDQAARQHRGRGHQRQPPDRYFHEVAGRRPRKVNGDQGRDRLGGGRDPGGR